MFRRRYAYADEPTVTRGSSVRGGGMAGRSALASIITGIAGVVAGTIVAGILLVVLDANPGNEIVQAVTDAARWLAGPFHDLFRIDSREWSVAVNWGLAAIVYVAIARLIARLLMR